MNLVIVESPTKAKKLREYLGKDFHIEASVGHVRDLPKKKLGIDIEHDFEPTYEISDDKKKVVTQLKKLSKTAETVYLAMDPDREGEAIAWHIQQLLGKQKFLRATFHEITKSAVQDAINHPGTLNMSLVDAQQARRVLDRLVGYQISPVLWKKIRRGLSAGRVQSVALKLIVEREREIAAFVPEEYWEVDVLMGIDQDKFTRQAKTTAESKLEWLENVPAKMLIGRVVEVNHKKYEPTKQEQVTDVLTGLESASYQILSVEKKSRKRSTFPPFTTSTLQQGAANKLGFTSKQTMTLAQQLYEEGLITYHRTDSVNLSTQAVTAARELISSEYGSDYLPGKPNFFSAKSKNAQEAHEAIRVTDLSIVGNEILPKSQKYTANHAKLYDLIWRKFVASQMTEALYDSTTVMTQASTSSEASTFTNAVLKTNGSVLKFDGWMKLFPGGEDNLLPDISAKQELFFKDLNGAQKFTQPPARYNDASLVKELEKRGIGRPSTYASIISVLEVRGYVSRDKKRFVASPVGMTVTDFLNDHFATIMDYDFTAEMEEDLDRVSRGEKDWRKIVKEFYTPFEKQIETVTDKADRVQIPVEKTGEKCPDCLERLKKGEISEVEVGEVVIRSGRFGKFKSCSKFPECKFTENIVDIVPDVKCPLCGKGDVISRNTRWGRLFYGCSDYPKCTWASWSQPKPGDTVTPGEWKIQQAARAEKNAKRKATMEARYGKSKAGKPKTKSKKKKLEVERRKNKVTSD